VTPFTIRCDYWKIPRVTSARPVGQCLNTLTTWFPELHQQAEVLGWELLRLRQFCPYHAKPLPRQALAMTSWKPCEHPGRFEANDPDIDSGVLDLTAITFCWWACDSDHKGGRADRRHEHGDGDA
jgi:hypothetical protein